MWQYSEDMHEVLGSRPSVDPPVIVSSFNDEDPVTIITVRFQLLLLRIYHCSLDVRM